jgi:hypothetical protein
MQLNALKSKTQSPALPAESPAQAGFSLHQWGYIPKIRT